MVNNNCLNNSMTLVNLSNGVSNEAWTKMIDDMYNKSDELEIGPEEIVDPAENVVTNPKAKRLRLSKNGFKTVQAEQNQHYDRLI